MSKAGEALTDVRRWLCDNLSDGEAGKVCGMLSVVSRRINELEYENAKLRELCTDLVRLPAASGFDCYGCKYDEWTDCRMDCKLIERAIELGIEATDA